MEGEFQVFSSCAHLSTSNNPVIAIERELNLNLISPSFSIATISFKKFQIVKCGAIYQFDIQFGQYLHRKYSHNTWMGAMNEISWARKAWKEKKIQWITTNMFVGVYEAGRIETKLLKPWGSSWEL